MKIILRFHLLFVCTLFQPTMFSMFQKRFNNKNFRKVVDNNFYKHTFARMPLNTVNKSSKITTYHDIAKISQPNQNLWSKIASRVKSWLGIVPKSAYSPAIPSGSLADIKIKDAKRGSSSQEKMREKIKSQSLSTPIGHRRYSIFKNEDRKFQSQYNDFTENDFTKEFRSSNDPEKLYRDLLKIYHPDVKRFSKEFCDERTKTINIAFENFKKLKDIKETTKKETSETKQTKTNSEGPIEDEVVKSTITQSWFKKKCMDDKYHFNKDNDLSYRDYFFPDNNTFSYYQIDLNADDGSIKSAINLTYNEAFTPTSIHVPEKYQKQMHEDWLRKQMDNDKYYFNNKYKLKGKLRHIINNHYYELTLERNSAKITSVVCLSYKEGEFVPTEEIVPQKTYQLLVADGFSFDQDNIHFNTNTSSSKFDKEILEKLMWDDAYSFNEKNNDKYRKMQYSYNNDLPRYYEFTVNLTNGSYIKVIELIYKNGNFIESQNTKLPPKEVLDSLFYSWTESKMHSDRYKFNESGKDKFRFIIQKPNAAFDIANIFRDLAGKKKKKHPDQGYYEASINFNSGTITKIIHLTFSNGTFVPTNQVSTDEKIAEEAYNDWIEFIIKKDSEAFNKKHQNKQRNLYASNPVQYYEAEFDVKNGTVIEAYWLDYKNGAFVKSTRKISQEELKKIYQINSKSE